jgi:phage gp36-like protein
MGTPYVTMTDLSGMIPLPFLVEGLDDNADGAADASVWSQVAADVSAVIDGKLGGRYTVPFTNPLPAIVVSAAKTLAAEQIYTRRGRTDADGRLVNPFTKQANDVRAQLDRIAAGADPLDPSKNRQQPSATVITGPSKTASTTGLST